MIRYLEYLQKVVLPLPLFQRLAPVGSRRWQVSFLRENGLLDIVKGYLAEHGTTVQLGPFAGLIYPMEYAIARWFVLELLGSYEREWHPFLSILAKRNMSV